MISKKYLYIKVIASLATIFFSTAVISNQISDFYSVDSENQVAAVSKSIEIKAPKKLFLTNSSSRTLDPFCYTFIANFKQGVREYNVEALQKILNREFPNQNLNKKNDTEPVAFFGNNTKLLVINFQKKYNLKPSGTIDDATRAKLNSLYGCRVAAPQLPTKGAVSGPVTESIFKVEDATPIDSFKILVRHYAIDQTIFYHPLIKCPTVGSSGSGFIERILSYLTLSIAYALTTNCSDEDTSSVERSNYDTISRDGYNSYIEYPYITSQHYYKSTSRCLWDDETIHDDEYSSAFPGNKTWTCPESRTATTGIPYTHTARRKGSGVSVWYIYYSNPVFPWNFIKQTEITDTIQEDSRADLIINGGDPDVEYLASIPVSAVPILPDSLRPGDKVSVNGWFYGDPIHCKKLSPAPGHAAVWSHNDPYSCYLKYLVRGNSITDVTPFFAGAPYYAYDVGGTPLTSVVPAGPAPSIISGTISYRGSMLANILSVMNSNLVTYTGTNIPTDGTATVLLYGNDNMYQIVPTVESESQFSFVVPDYLPVGMYSVRIMGGNTMPSEPITLNVLNRYIRPYDPLPPGTRGTGSATSTDTVPSDGRDYSAP